MAVDKVKSIKDSMPRDLLVKKEARITLQPQNYVKFNAKIN